MKNRVGALLFVIILFGTASAFPLTSEGNDEHAEWIAKSLTEMESIKVGMTRADLLKVFKEEGGISTRTWRRYAYRDCPYIKVDVHFEAVGEPAPRFAESPRDKITKISKPFLERSILD